MPKVNRSKKKLKLRMVVESLGTELPKSKVEELIQWLQERKTQLYSEGWSDLEILVEHGIWEEASELNLYGTRQETDKEYSVRMKSIEKEKQKEQLALKEHKKEIEAEARKLGLLK